MLRKFEREYLEMMAAGSFNPLYYIQKYKSRAMGLWRCRQHQRKFERRLAFVKRKIKELRGETE
jgi:hypothetical protein